MAGTDGTARCLAATGFAVRGVVGEAAVAAVRERVTGETGSAMGRDGEGGKLSLP